MDDSPRDDQRALALIQSFGRTGIAFQALGRGLNHWFVRRDDRERGVVAYFDTGSAWVSAGEPIAAHDDTIPVAAAFVDAARARGRRVVFFATEGILASSPRFRRLQIGEQPVWDPARWRDDVRTHKSMREQLRRARAKGVTVRALTLEEYAGASSANAGSGTESSSHSTSDANTRATLDALISRWHAARPMAPMHFIVDMAPFDHATHRRVYVAEREGVVVAMLSLAPVPAREGWLFEHLLRDPRAPNGTAELLVDHVMQALNDESVRWVTLGLAPLSGDVNGWLRLARQLSRPFFNFTGLAAFKRKLRPHAWEPMYLAFPREQHGAVALLESLRAFADGSLLRFGFATARRGPTPLLRALEWLLVPWTLVLALAPTVPWFPSDVIHSAWVFFDIALIGALHVHRRTGDARLACAAAIAVSLDALLTTMQALWWNAPRVRHPLDVIAIIVACAGPAITAPVLWGAVRRLQALHAGRSAPTSQPLREPRAQG